MIIQVLEQFVWVREVTPNNLWMKKTPQELENKQKILQCLNLFSVIFSYL